jgi:hypothetical protein
VPSIGASCVNGLCLPFRAVGQMIGKLGTNVKLLLIGGLMGLAIGVGLTVLYFSLATFFEVNAKALDAKALTKNSLSAIQKAAEKANEKAKDVTAQTKGRLDESGKRFG